MRRSASEIIRNLESRVALLERQAGKLKAINDPKMFWDLKSTLQFEHDMSSQALSHLNGLAFKRLKGKVRPYDVLDFVTYSRVTGNTVEENFIEIFFKVKYIREHKADPSVVGLSEIEREAFGTLTISRRKWEKCKGDVDLCILKSNARAVQFNAFGV